MSLGPLGQASQEKRPSATPPSSAIAAFAPREDQSGMKKQFVDFLMSFQSAALAGPSKVETRG